MKKTSCTKIPVQLELGIAVRELVQDPFRRSVQKFSEKDVQDLCLLCKGVLFLFSLSSSSSTFLLFYLQDRAKVCLCSVDAFLSSTSPSPTPQSAPEMSVPPAPGSANPPRGFLPCDLGGKAPPVPLLPTCLYLFPLQPVPGRIFLSSILLVFDLPVLLPGCSFCSFLLLLSICTTPPSTHSPPPFP